MSPAQGAAEPLQATEPLQAVKQDESSADHHAMLDKVMAYTRSHWPSEVKREWQVELSEYPAILARVLKDFTKDASRTRHFVRIAGLSGSGKTSQILPAAEAYFEALGLRPVLIAARRFVEYHPHYAEILAHYGEANLRRHTDEFATIMLFLTIHALTRAGYDIILDVALLSPEIEAILLRLLGLATSANPSKGAPSIIPKNPANNAESRAPSYAALYLMVATSPAVTEHFLGARGWRHTEATEQEFIRAAAEALDFYSQAAPNLPIILWSVYDRLPIYDGPISGCLDIFKDYSTRTTLPATDDALRRKAKIDYLTTQEAAESLEQSRH
ncbi:zeta toxin family protein [Candidatus Saccharibacteria bacterium]|nr:zeta toxin family protein [Candidatus Saccharibacteria bacterium]